MSDQSWRERAACQGKDTEIFFTTDSSLTAGTARAICRKCPVRVDCFAWALRVPEQYGIWGGVGQSERMALSRGRVRLKCPSCKSRELARPSGALQACLACGLSWRVRQIAAAA